MADYDDGASGQVLNESYCMKKSVEAKNVDSMNVGYGYNNLADLANTKPYPASMQGAKSNPQKGATAATNNYNYDKDRG